MPELREQENEAIRRVLSGDKEAYRILVLLYSSRIIAFCRTRLEASGVRDAEDEAKDLAQEVFIRAYVSLRRFRLGESFAAWLFAIAANRVKSRFRFFARQRKLEESAINAAQTLPEEGLRNSSDAAELMRIQGEALLRGIALLPKDIRLPMELYYVGELSVAETAQVLKLGQEAVKTRLFRGRKALKDLTERRKPYLDSRGIQ
jgi:RNA polymerase sigma-70 factor (ECF subfamily)